MRNAKRRAKTISDKQKQLQREQEDDQNDFQQEMQETFNGVAQKVGDVLIAYAQQHGYTLVLDGGEQQAQIVLYAQSGDGHQQGDSGCVQPEVRCACTAAAGCSDTEAGDQTSCATYPRSPAAISAEATPISCRPGSFCNRLASRENLKTISVHRLCVDRCVD